MGADNQEWAGRGQAESPHDQVTGCGTVEGYVALLRGGRGLSLGRR